MSKQKNNYSNDETKGKPISYYDVLGVSPSATLADIKKHFRKLVIKYHPDNKEFGDATLFALAARAYECLSDEQKREEYDRLRNIEEKARKSDFVNHKRAFEEYIKAQEEENNPKAIEHAKQRFAIEFQNMDKKRGFDRSKYEEKPISVNDALKRMRDIELEREQEELGFMQENLFDNGQKFDHEKFHALFEKMYKTNDDNGQIVRHGNPTAFNTNIGTSFVPYDDNNVGDDLYGEENYDEDESGNGLYSNFGNYKQNISVTKDDMRNMNNFKSSYNSHNEKTSDYKSEIERKLREREQEDKLYNDRKIQDFDTDSKMGGYGFLHQVGLTGQEEDWSKEEVDIAAFKKLLAYQQMEKRSNNSIRRKR